MNGCEEVPPELGKPSYEELEPEKPSGDKGVSVGRLGNNGGSESAPILFLNVEVEFVEAVLL